MAEAGYPCVYVVDSHARGPPVPPRLTQKRKSGGVAQPLLFLLVSLALCGMIIEACFIFHLYNPTYASSASSSKIIAGEDVTAPTTQPTHGFHPSKPAAHLTDGVDVVHGKRIMGWSLSAEPLLYEMDYRNKALIIQKEGYYYVYSKVFFSDSEAFYHYVNMRTDKYAGGTITLLQARKYSPKSGRTRSNSYLGGVFQLFKNDALYVEVNNTAKIVRHKPYENVFGAFMI